MGGKKRAPCEVRSSISESEDDSVDVSLEEGVLEAEGSGTTLSRSVLKPMERRKKRKALDKERHRSADAEGDASLLPGRLQGDAAAARHPQSSPSGGGLPLHLFMELTSLDSSVRQIAAETLALELWKIQEDYVKLGEDERGCTSVLLEAEKDDGFEGCAPPVRYAVRRLIRGLASSRECARQGFALGLSVVIGSIRAIKVESIQKLVVQFLEISSSKKGQDLRDCLLGRLFAFGSLARSGRITAEWALEKNAKNAKEIIAHLAYLAGKKHYLREPAVLLILELMEKLPEALLKQVMESDDIQNWLQKAPKDGDPDALLLALKLQEQALLGHSMIGKLLPHPFSPNAFFSREHLSLLLPLLKETTFCSPRVHSLWHTLLDLLLPAVTLHDEEPLLHHDLSKKQKKSRKGNSVEDIANNFHCFYEVVVEGALLLSSHDRKLLAFDIILLMLPKLPTGCIQVVLSQKFVHCLMDILSTKTSWLYNAAQNFLKEMVNWIGSDDDRRVAVIVSLQRHSNGRFDCIIQSHTIRELILKFVTIAGRMLLAQKLMNLFVDEGSLADEPSDASQTTDENSERGSPEGEDPIGISGNTDFLKSWIIDTLAQVLKTLKVESKTDSSNSTEIRNLLEAKFRLRADIMKFLAVQGLFSASLGTEVTSFELQEKFTWPKAANSSSLCKSCIERLQLLMEDAQRGETMHLSSNYPDSNDLGSFFICFLNTMCSIPSVSLFWAVNEEDEKAFKDLQLMETRLYHEERRISSCLEANKLRAMRYLLIQLLLQLVLHPGELSDVVEEIILCCRKAFPVSAQFENVDVEYELDDDGTPELMDVLVDNLLALLPQSSGPMSYAVEQVFRFFCDDITDGGLLRMLHIVKKDLRPPRHQSVDTDDEGDEDDLFGIEESEANEAKAVESEDSDDHVDDSEAMTASEARQKDNNDKQAEPSVSEAYDSDMDDDAMFLMDSYLAQLLKDRRNSSGSDTAQSQLMLFKLRVLSLLEIYLQRNPGRHQVLVVYSYLIQAFVNSHSSEGRRHLGARIQGILQKKIFKAKEHPRGDVQKISVQTLLEKSLRLASHSRIRVVSSLAESATLWLLKIIHLSDFSGSEREKVFDTLRHAVIDYFDNKKSRLKSSFIKEVFRRHPWIADELFQMFLERCGSAKSEFRRVEALDVLESTLKLLIPSNKGDKDNGALSTSKFLKRHLSAFSELFTQLVSKFPEKQARRADVRRFCCKILKTLSSYNLLRAFFRRLPQETYSSCESKLGDQFVPFKKPFPLES